MKIDPEQIVYKAHLWAVEGEGKNNKRKRWYNVDNGEPDLG